MQVNFRKSNENAVTPTYANIGDAGMDMVAVTKSESAKYIEYNTHIQVEIPIAHVGLIFQRSSVSNKDIFLANAVGVIDSTYRGDIKFRFKKITKVRHYINSVLNRLFGTNYDTFASYDVGDRIGQLMIIPYIQIEMSCVSDLSDTARGSGGYGSTGK
jgi:dUTP pyrophosphatase